MVPQKNIQTNLDGSGTYRKVLIESQTKRRRGYFGHGKQRNIVSNIKYTFKNLITFFTKKSQPVQSMHMHSRGTFVIPSPSKSQSQKSYFPKQFSWKYVSVVSLILIVGVSSYLSLRVQGATYTFTQSSWTGGVDVAVANHAANQSGWNKYSSATNVAAGSDVTMSVPGNYSFTDDGTTSTTSTLTTAGGGFGNGALSNASVTGSGTDASVGISPIIVPLNDWDRIAPVPVNVHLASQMIRNGSENNIYLLPGDNTNRFYQYEISSNIWTALTNVPSTVYYGSLMIRNGSDDEIYVAPGNNTTAFYKYSISGNSWTTLTSTLAGVSGGSQFMRNGSDNDIYMLRGGSAGFYKYSISGNSWTSLTSLPGSVSGDGSQMIRNGSDDDIYVAAGSGTGFYKYSIAGNSWTSLATTPGGSMGYGVDLLRYGSSDTIYLLQGEGTGFHKYSIAGNSWTTLTASPSYIRNSGQMIRNGADDDIYVLPGWGPAMVKYTITTNSWTTLTNVPASLVNGAQMIRNGADNDLYIVAGTGTDGFYKYSISGNSWKGSTVSNTLNSPAGANYGGQMIRNGSDDEIYMLPGDFNTHIYKYSIAANTWTMLAASPGAPRNGAQMMRNGSDDAIYVMAGLGTGFYRYSISGNSWTTLTGVPASVSNGGQMIRNGADNDIYVVAGGSTSGLYRYSISGNSWTSLTNVPESTSSGCQMIRSSNSNDIYLMPGGYSAGLYRYSISGNSWTTLTSVAGAVNYGAQMKRNGSDNDIYLTLGGNSTGFYRYSISGNSWTALTSAPGGLDAGSIIIRNGADDVMYITRGASTNNFFRYSISGNSWTTLYSAFGSLGDGAQMIRNGSDNEIYVTQGNSNTGFYRFIINNVTYDPAGIFTSDVIDVGAKANFSTLANGAGTSLPTGTAVTYDVRAGNVLVPDGTWTSWTTGIASGDSLSAFAGYRYMQYRANLSTSVTRNTPSIAAVTLNYAQYLATGSLVSSAYDSSSAANVLGKISWTGTGTSGDELIRMQMRSSADGITWSNWCGYADCSGSTYFDQADNGVALSGSHPLQTGGDDQYFQYQTTLTSGGVATPTLTNVVLQYVVNAAPEIQNITASQGTDGLVAISYDVRDSDSTTGNTNPGFVTPSFQYWNGAAWINTTTMTAGTGNKAVDETDFTTYTATWNAPTDFSNQYFASTVKIRVKINDNEGANNITTGDSTAFVFDTTTPTGSNVTIDATTTPATLHLSATDDSSILVMYSLDSGFSGASWESYATTKTLALATDPDTVYVKFKDAYGNTTSTLSATTPETPNGLMIQDTTNMASVPEYRLFSAWKTIVNPTAGFGHYDIMRADEFGAFSLVDTVPSRLTNYFADNSIIGDTVYRYRVVAVDALGNTSYLSSIVSGKANGIQDAGEGGGGVDTTPPAISNVSISNIFTTQATFTWDTNELSFSTIGRSGTPGVFTTEIGVADLADNASGVGSHRVVVTGLTPNTTYWVRVKSTDVKGNFVTDDNGGNGYSFTTLPGPAITGIALQNATNTTTTVTWNTTTPATTKIKYSESVVSGNLVSPTEIGTGDLVTSHSQKVTGLTSGVTYYFSVHSLDGSGNEGLSDNGGNFYQFTTTVDNTAPTITSIAVPLKAYDSALVTWVTNEPATSQVKYSLVSGGPYTNTVASTTYDTAHAVILSGLTADTVYYFQVVSEDSNANTATSSETSVTTSLDPSFVHSTLSSITNISTPPTILTDTEAMVVFETDQDAVCSLDYGTSTGVYTNNVTVESVYTRIHALHLSGLIFSTPYFYNITCTDNLATTITSAEKTFTTQVAQQDVPVSVPDTTAPSISVIATPLKTNDTVLVTWTTDELATSQVQYATTSGGPYTTTPASVTYDAGHAVILTGLNSSTTYYYKITSVDLSSNTVVSNEESFVTATNPALNHPALSEISTISDPPTFLTDQKAVITFKTDQSALCYIQYGIATGQYTETPVSETLYNREHAIHLTTLALSTPYFYRINCMDNAYHVVVSDEKTFTTLAKQVASGSEAGDIIAPTISNVSVSSITGETAVVTWDTDENANSLVRYGLTNTFGDMAGDDIVNTDTTKYDTKHTVTIKNLIPGKTKYFFTVLSSDLAGNVGQSGENDFTTKDAAAISSIRSFSQKIGEITIAWKTSAKTTSLVEYGLTESYTDKKESNSIATDHEITLSGLVANTMYHFRVRGVDTLKNAFASNDLTFEPKSPPAISNVAIETLSEREAKVTFNSNIPTDALVVFQGIDNTKESGSQGDPTFTQTHTIVLKNLRPGTKYRATIKAQDETGNASQNSEKTFETKSDAAAPVINQIRTDVALTQNNKVQALISWTTDELATSSILYREGQYGEEKELVVSKDLSQNHISVITSFKPGNVYYFRVKVADDFGNEFISKDYMALTPKRTENIVEVIVGNFKDIFSWAK